LSWQAGAFIGVMLNIIEKVEALAKVSLFAQLGARERLLIALICTEEELAVGEILCQQGEEGDELYLILEGVVSVRIGSNEESKEVARMGSGSCIGEMSLFSGKPRNATLVVEEKSRILFLSGVMLHELIRDYPQISLGVIQSLVQRLEG